MSTFLRSALKSVSEKPCAIEDVLETRLHGLEPECAPHALQTSERWAPQKGTVRSLENCERSIKTLARMPSNTSMERPPQLVSVFSIRRELADHLRAVLGPDGAHDVVLRARSHGQQILR